MRKQLFLPLTALLAACTFGPPAAAQERVAVVNAATFEAGFPVSPGCWASAFGDFASVGILETFADSVPLPTVLGGVQVFVNGIAAPMNYVGRGQINFIVPRDVPDTGKVPFRIAVAGNTTYEGSIPVWPISPGLVSINPADPAKPGAVLNQDGTVNSSTNPARRGDVVQIFGVGADFAELPADGSPAPADRLIPTATLPKVWVSVAEARVQFSGLAPNLVGTWQLNVVVPDEPFVKGQVPVLAEVRGVKTNLVSIWVAE